MQNRKLYGIHKINRLFTFHDTSRLMGCCPIGKQDSSPWTMKDQVKTGERKKFQDWGKLQTAILELAPMWTCVDGLILTCLLFIGFPAVVGPSSAFSWEPHPWGYVSPGMQKCNLFDN